MAAVGMALLSVERRGPRIFEAMTPMRDGVRLHTRVWLPAKRGRWPVVLQRGYWPGNDADAKRFVEAGYAYVGQSCRGHAKSEGENNRFFDDASDGYDAIGWIVEQPWCDGDVAMYGKSYMAITQWLVAPSQHPNLRAIVPQNSSAELWDRGYWCNGAFTFAMTATGRVFDASKVDAYDWQRLLKFLPLIDLDKEVTGHENGLWRDYLTHSTYDDFWKAIGIGDGYDKIDLPVYVMGGWYDYYPGAAFNDFAAIVKAGKSSDVRIVVSATDHLNRVVGDRDLTGGGKDELAMAIRWLDHVVKGEDNGVADESPIRLFTMGVNEWRFEREWPLARTQFTNYYFHADGKLHGGLSTTPPADEPPTQYTYDPADPVPTLGGNHSCVLNIPEIIRAGAVDQRPNETRDDVLVFTGELLTEDVEVTGPVTVVLYAASSATDTDFVARLIDVLPDGTAYNLTEGIIRARFRASIHEPPTLLTPGAVYEYRIALLPTSNVFLKGHRIRVHVTSSGFPLWDRNPNTGHSQGMDDATQVARQTVYHDRDRPSHVVLPIIPREPAAAADGREEQP